MRTDSSNNTWIYAGIIVVALLLFVGIQSGKINLTGLSKASTVNSVSTVNYASNSGTVQNGQLFGAKMQFATTLTPEPLDVVYKLAKTDQTWGNYKITPQSNLRIKMSSTGSAEASTALYRRSYYKDSSGLDVQTQDLLGVGAWQILTPIHLEILADANPVPTSPVLTMDVAGSQLQGQQFMPIGNGINIQRSSIAQTGNNLLPDLSNIVVATSPSETELQNAGFVSDYVVGTFIFNRASYDSAVQKFYNQAGQNGWFRTLNDPLQALWTGYDDFTYIGGICGRLSSSYNNGYCKLQNWNGLYREAARLSYPMRFESGTQKLIADNINFGANMNLEIPSDIVRSYAVLRGVGVADFTLSISQNIQEGNRLQATVTVTNRGDNDGFNVWITSSSGKLVFSPSSYSNQYIAAGQSQQFQFVMTVAGKSNPLPLAASENVMVDVQPVHGTKVKKTQNVAIAYNAITSTQNDQVSQYQQQQGTFTGSPNVQQQQNTVQPTNANTMTDLTNNTYRGINYSVDFISWFNSGKFILLIFLITALLITAYTKYKEQ